MMLRTALLRSSKVVALKQLSARHLSRTARILGAQVFSMPAMSPTMERGGIVEWKYKVGEPFSAGDVILEVETDKAQIDVEAQDDGKLAKIVIDNGAKDVAVGETIAYLAEVDDDLSTLEYPKSSTEPKGAEVKKSTPGNETEKKPAKDEKKVQVEGKLQKANPVQTLLPSVSILLAENHISKEDAFDKIKATGRDGRLLKGDVLAYLGKISADSNVKIADYIKSGERLDLSNIELRTKDAKPTPALEEKDAKETRPVKPEPVIFSEQLILEVPTKSNSDQLQKSVKEFLKEAYQYTHASPLGNTSSDYFDPIFEDLLTPAPTKPRFSYTYQLVSLVDRTDAEVHQDIFDLLSDSTPETSSVAHVESPSKQEYALSFSVQVDEKFHDAEDKAKRFIEYVKQLEYV